MSCYLFGGACSLLRRPFAPLLVTVVIVNAGSGPAVVAEAEVRRVSARGFDPPDEPASPREAGCEFRVPADWAPQRACERYDRLEERRSEAHEVGPAVVLSRDAEEQEHELGDEVAWRVMREGHACVVCAPHEGEGASGDPVRCTA